MEISNPGIPVVPSERFIDTAPVSRNERLASLMRRLGVCEERGSGWDKVALSVEANQLPAPRIDVTETHTRISLFGPKPLSQMDREERVRAVYQHACLRFVMRENTTNSTIRKPLPFLIVKRLGLPAS